MTSATLRIVALVGLTAPALFGAAPDLAGTRTALEQWIELRKTISEEQSAWKADRETLRSTIELLKSEITRLDLAIRKAGASTAAASAQREQLNRESEKLRQTSAV